MDYSPWGCKESDTTESLTLNKEAPTGKESWAPRGSLGPPALG